MSSGNSLLPRRKGSPEGVRNVNMLIAKGIYAGPFVCTLAEAHRGMYLFVGVEEHHLDTRATDVLRKDSQFGRQSSRTPARSSGKEGTAGGTAVRCDERLLVTTLDTLPGRARMMPAEIPFEELAPVIFHCGPVAAALSLEYLTEGDELGGCDATKHAELAAMVRKTSVPWIIAGDRNVDPGGIAWPARIQCVGRVGETPQAAAKGCQADEVHLVAPVLMEPGLASLVDSMTTAIYGPWQTHAGTHLLVIRYVHARAGCSAPRSARVYAPRCAFAGAQEELWAYFLWGVTTCYDADGAAAPCRGARQCMAMRFPRAGCNHSHELLPCPRMVTSGYEATNFAQAALQGSAEGITTGAAALRVFPAAVTCYLDLLLDDRQHLATSRSRLELVTELAGSTGVLLGFPQRDDHMMPDKLVVVSASKPAARAAMGLAASSGVRTKHQVFGGRFPGFMTVSSLTAFPKGTRWSPWTAPVSLRAAKFLSVPFDIQFLGLHRLGRGILAITCIPPWDWPCDGGQLWQHMYPLWRSALPSVASKRSLPLTVCLVNPWDCPDYTATCFPPHGCFCSQWQRSLRQDVLAVQRGTRKNPALRSGVDLTTVHIYVRPIHLRGHSQNHGKLGNPLSDVAPSMLTCHFCGGLCTDPLRRVPSYRGDHKDAIKVVNMLRTVLWKQVGTCTPSCLYFIAVHIFTLFHSVFIRASEEILELQVYWTWLPSACTSAGLVLFGGALQVSETPSAMHPVALMGIHAQLEAGRAELELTAIQAASASEAGFPGPIPGCPLTFPPMERGGLLGPLRIAARSELPVRSRYYYTRSGYFSFSGGEQSVDAGVACTYAGMAMVWGANTVAALGFVRSSGHSARHSHTNNG